MIIPQILSFFQKVLILYNRPVTYDEINDEYDLI